MYSSKLSCFAIVVPASTSHTKKPPHPSQNPTKHHLFYSIDSTGWPSLYANLPVATYDYLSHISVRDSTLLISGGTSFTYTGLAGAFQNTLSAPNDYDAFIAKLTYGNVVRLKGGDPFIFGRGSEEIEFVESFGIPTFVVPGISSAVAVPAYQGISLTKRGVSESFWVITGTTSERNLSNDIGLAAQSTATVVILMGMSKLEQIVSLFQNQSKGETPIAIIQNGTLSNEKVGIGTIDTIQKIVEEKQLNNPAIIVIGEVVRERNNLKAVYNELLSNKICPRE